MHDDASESQAEIICLQDGQQYLEVTNEGIMEMIPVKVKNHFALITKSDVGSDAYVACGG